MDATQQQIETYSDTKKFPILITVHSDTQEYVDEPVYKLRLWKLKIWIVILLIFGWTPRLEMRKLIAYKRFILRWSN